MNRREFLKTLPVLGAGGFGLTAVGFWPEQGFRNSCLASLPESLRRHPLMRAVWEGMDSNLAWDCHAHLVGSGDSGGGAWFSPDMDSLRHPLLRLQKWFYLNAGCVDVAPGSVDRSYVERLRGLVGDMNSGFKAVLLAFDWRHDESGKPDRAHSIFHIPNAYAAEIARRYPASFEWAASVHPYRPDCVEAVQQAAKDGARAVKWLPSAMGIDPASPRCDRFYQALAQAGLPLISHAGRELAVQGGSQDDGNPLKLRRAMDHGVRVVIAHCASDGDDVDLDKGENGPRVKSFELFARLMDEARYDKLVYGDISALTQFNRAWALKTVLRRGEWHARLLNGSDYPLPGVMPLFSAGNMADMGLLDGAAVPVLKEVRAHNPLLFDFALKRLLNLAGQRFPASVFETRRFFDRRVA
ncbi:MAG: amidohydrolase family protein [Sulfuricella sp.]|nr:amidohydrolase family protein [Sulfuricella sp.]